LKSAISAYIKQVLPPDIIFKGEFLSKPALGGTNGIRVIVTFAFTSWLYEVAI
jgi:hypothetical protein